MFLQLPALMTQLHPTYNYQYSTSGQLMLPCLVPLLLATNLLVNFFIFCYLAFKECLFQNKRVETILKKEESLYTSERNEEMKRMLDASLNNPLRVMMPAKYCTRFIEDGEESEVDEEKVTFEKNLNSFLHQEHEKAIKVLKRFR